MNVIFVNYNDFRSPSGMHIFHLANALAGCGVSCAVYNNGIAETATLHGRPKFRSYGRRLSPRRLAAELDAQPGETLVHCWTPRERARIPAEALAEELGAPVVVHMEDNEEAITRANADAAAPGDPDGGPDSDAAWQMGGSMYGCSHPVRYREFLARSAGYTCIIESLLDFKPAHVPGHVFWPACEAEVFAIPQASCPEEKRRWGMEPESVVLFYPGNIHKNNAQEVLNLYAAVVLLRRAGVPAKILKFGKYRSLDVRKVIFAPHGVEDALVDLTEKITPAEIPQVMRAADILVQPGEDNEFNHYRFPCKLPLFLASGRPVILPPSNLGNHLTDGENCLLLHNDKPGPIEIAELVMDLVANPQKAARIGKAGREFAQEHCNWDESAKGLKAFYEKILASA